MKYLYITEPDTLDMTTIQEALHGTDWEAVAGDTAFTGSRAHAYEALLIRSATKVTKAIYEYFPNLHYVVRAGVGLDNVDTSYCQQNDIQLFNAPGANAEAVSDYTLAMMLFGLRKLYKKHTSDITDWNRFKFTAHNMAEQTVGIVGYGNIGKRVHKKLLGFGCSVLVYDPYIATDTVLEAAAKVVSFEELLRQSSIISLHLPLTKETKYLIGRHTMGLIQENAILINASRGGIVEETAVIATLNTKDFVYIADTVEGEPVVNRDLLSHENIVLTPHIASLTEESEHEMITTALSNFLDGKTATIF